MDKRVLACNFTVATSKNSKGSLAYVGYGGDFVTRLYILTRTRSGRWVECWEPVKRLGNFRFKTMPPEHPLYNHFGLRDWSDTIGTDRDPVKWLKERAA